MYSEAEATSGATRLAEPLDSVPRQPEAGNLLPAAIIDGAESENMATTRGLFTQDTVSSNVVPGDFSSSPTGSVNEEKIGGLARLGSVKSSLDRRGRNRSSANTTGMSSMASASALASASASAVNLANAARSSAVPFPSAGGPRLTGFAIASKKRNRDFHNLFKSVSDDDYLIEDYSCAIQREILAHGRLYVSEGHLCFSSNIFGWITTLVMSFSEIVSVEKRSTALVFKNGLMITTLHAKHIFASFTSRDATYDLIINIWKLGHPSLQSSLNGIRLEGTGGDKTEKIHLPPTLDEADEAAAGTGSVDVSEDEDDIYDEDDDEDDNTPDASLANNDTLIAEAEADKANASRKQLAAMTGIMAGTTPELSSPTEPFPATMGAAAAAVDSFPGPTTHAPTDCADLMTHFDKIVGDEIVPAPLGQVYTKLFGPESVTWMAKWLQGDQKCTELQMEDKLGLSRDNKGRTYSYIKPLNAPLGPRSTKCIVSETIDYLDLERAVCISCSTITPDVPSGNVFSTKTKYSLTWAKNNSTRLQASCMVEWTGKSWIKGEYI